MAYWEQMQGGLTQLARAAEDGRRDLDQMIAPVVVRYAVRPANWRGCPACRQKWWARCSARCSIERAQVKVNKVVNTYNSATCLEGHRRAHARLGEQVDRARMAVDKVVGKVSGSLGSLLPTSVLAPKASASDYMCAIPQQHLLVMTVLSSPPQVYFFNIDTVPFDKATRTSQFNWKEQARLGRRLESVGVGTETLLLHAVVMPALSRASGKRVGHASR